VGESIKHPKVVSIHKWAKSKIIALIKRPIRNPICLLEHVVAENKEFTTVNKGKDLMHDCIALIKSNYESPA
jgi:hypothetical protein